MRLYRLENRINNNWYVIADNPTEAENILESALYTENYGFTEQRKVTKIELVATEIEPALNSKFFFSGGDNLIIGCCKEHGENI